MPCRLACLMLALGLAAAPRAALAEVATLDPEVVKGVSLAEEGDYDGAILTLDNAARRLAADPAKIRDLSQAYLYLGIAYLGKGHEAAARASFREALSRTKELVLSPEKFPPKVIDLFEAAREEATRTTTAAPTQRSGTEPTTSEQKKGSHKGILIGAGVAVAAGVGVAAAAGGGDGDGTTTPGDGTSGDRITETFSGTLCADYTVCEQYRQFNITVGTTGTLEATATWTEARAQFTMELQNATDRPIAVSNRLSDTSARLQASVTPQTYKLYIDRQDEIPDPFSFSLTVLHP
jgi:tetratricopeptide (TPR) repeat protein